MKTDVLVTFTRRTELVGVVGTTAMSSLRLRARHTSLKVPVVNALTLTVPANSATFAHFLPNMELAGLKVVRAENGEPSG